MLTISAVALLVCGVVSAQNQVPPSCQTVRCSADTRCALQQVYCFAAPCYPIPECVPQASYDQHCSKLNCPDSDCVIEASGATSWCAPTPCQDTTCKMFCIDGFKRNAEGCTICECNWTSSDAAEPTVDGCPDDSVPLSQVFCGRGPNRKECPSTHYCDIAPDDTHAFCCKRDVTTTTTPPCQDTTCKMFCIGGFRRNAEGCTICECNWTSADRRSNCVDGSKPLSVNGRQLFCGMSPFPDHCPTSYFCDVAPDDSHAFCCKRTAQPPPPTAGCAVTLCGPGTVCKETNGVGKCVLQAICPAVRCLLKFRCLYGFARDANGCQTCNCKKAPCQDTMCEMFCINGFKRNADGCTICECNSGGSTTPCQDTPLCKRLCANGFKRNEDGCTICECNSVAPTTSDPITNPFQNNFMRMMQKWLVRLNAVNDKNSKGLMSFLNSLFNAKKQLKDFSVCKSQYRCPYLKCRAGRVRDENNCETCQCSQECPMVKCIPCSNGYVVDARGCQTCTCKRAPVCGPVCMVFCPNGNVMDSNGCPTCTCKPAPVCGPVCMIFCPNGNVMDSEGCPTCTCKLDVAAAPAAVTDPRCPKLTGGMFGICVEGCPAGGCPDGEACCSNGCGHTCQSIVSIPFCPPHICPLIFCPNGYTKDANGCDTCKCAGVMMNT